MNPSDCKLDPCHPPKFRWPCQILWRNIGIAVLLLCLPSQVRLQALSSTTLIATLPPAVKNAYVTNIWTTWTFICVPSLFFTQPSIQVINAVEINSILSAGSTDPSAAVGDSPTFDDAGRHMYRRKLQTTGELKHLIHHSTRFDYKSWNYDWLGVWCDSPAVTCSHVSVQWRIRSNITSCLKSHALATHQGLLSFFWSFIVSVDLEIRENTICILVV